MHHGALAACHLNAANDAAGDGEGGQGVALGIDGVAVEGHHQEPGYRRQNAAENVGNQHRFGDADAGIGCGLGVIAYHMEPVAELGLIHPQAQQNHDHHKDDHRRGQPAETEELCLCNDLYRVGIGGSKGALGKVKDQTLEQVVGGDGGNQRGNADFCNHKAIEQTGQRTGEQRNHDGDDERQGAVATGGCIDRVEAQNCGHTGKASLEAHGQVDVAGDHHQTQTQADHAIDAGIDNDVVKAVFVAVYKQKANRQQHRKDQHGIVVLYQANGLIALYFFFHSLIPLSFSTSMDSAVTMITPIMTHWT